MEELIIVTPTDGRRPLRPAAVRDAVSAYQTAAWRTPPATRFDGRPANDAPAGDFLTRAAAMTPRASLDQPMEMESIPRWMIVAIGAVVAAILGALLGGALSV